MTPIAVVDSETTGLDPFRHEMWELAIITADHDPDLGIVNEKEFAVHLPVDLSKADPTGLRVGRFYERYNPQHIADPGVAARAVAKMLDGRTLIGAVPNFDEKFLERWLRRFDQCGVWHYHLVCVENLAAGWLMGRAAGVELAGESTDGFKDDRHVAMPPWNSNELSRAIGVEPDDFDRHTALGDVEWALAIYKAVNGCP